jgi:hypothetical protein
MEQNTAGSDDQLQYWGLEELFRCGSLVVRREAGIKQFI